MNFDHTLNKGRDLRLRLASPPLSEQDYPVHLWVKVDGIARCDTPTRSTMPAPISHIICAVWEGMCLQKQDWDLSAHYYLVVMDVLVDLLGFPSGLPHCM